LREASNSIASHGVLFASHISFGFEPHEHRPLLSVRLAVFDWQLTRVPSPVDERACVQASAELAFRGSGPGFVVVASVFDEMDRRRIGGAVIVCLWCSVVVSCVLRLAVRVEEGSASVHSFLAGFVSSGLLLRSLC
jgi:hypothetical protein